MEEVVDTKGIVGQCPTLKMLCGIDKCMCCAAQEETTQVNFQFDAHEGSLQMSLWRLVSCVYGYSTACGVPLEGMMYHGWQSSMARCSPLECNIPATLGLFFRGEDAGDICNV